MITKKVNAKGNTTRVTFELPGDIAADSVAVVGNFNEWNPEANPMKLLKKGTWKTALTLENDAEYEFRYFLDGANWANDEAADGTTPTEYFSENSVLAL